MARRHHVWLWLTVALLLLAATAAVWHNARRMREVDERLRFSQELLCVALAYHRFAEDRGVSPHGLADIEAERGTFPQVYDMIRGGSFVVRWEAQLTGDGEENDKYVLGYESKAPSEGGWVLMGGGGRRDVSAGEFHALPLIPTR